MCDTLWCFHLLFLGSNCGEAYPRQSPQSLHRVFGLRLPDQDWPLPSYDHHEWWRSQVRTNKLLCRADSLVSHPACLFFSLVNTIVLPPPLSQVPHVQCGWKESWLQWEESVFLHSSDHLRVGAPPPAQDNLQRPETRECAAGRCGWTIKKDALSVGFNFLTW